MDYSKAKKLHPKLNVRSAKRLIAAIRGSERSPGSFRILPVKSGGRPATPSMLRTDGSLAKSGGNYPIYFDMDKWMSVVESKRPRDGSGSGACGTAACIAGFAYVLRAQEGKKPRHATMAGFRSWTSRTRGVAVWSSMVKALADYLGVDAKTAERMASVSLSARGLDDSNRDVEPRHAVRMLESFLETGEVEWSRAMGRKKDGTLTVAELKKRRTTAKSMVDRFGIESTARH